MAKYRVFPVDDERRRIVDLPSVIECEDDRAAIEYARHLGSGRVVEIWDRHRCVGIVTRDGRALHG